MTDLQKRLEMYLQLFTPAANCVTWGQRMIFINGDEKILIIIVPTLGIESKTTWDMYIEGEEIILQMGDIKSTIQGYRQMPQAIFLKSDENEVELNFISSTRFVQ